MNAFTSESMSCYGWVTRYMGDFIGDLVSAWSGTGKHKGYFVGESTTSANMWITGCKLMAE